MLNDIIRFKIHIQGSLEAYEEFVAGEVEREWDEQAAANLATSAGGHGMYEERVDDVDMDE